MSNNTGLKFGGRTKGTKNKITSNVKLALMALLEKEIEQLPMILEQLEPKQRIEILIKIMPYLIPKAESENSEEQQALRIEVIEKLVVI